MAAYVPTIAALRALATGAAAVYVQGYYAAGDGGGGYYNLGTAGTDNGGTVITSANGTYLLDTQGAVSVRQFGARGDGTTDDTGAINACLQAALVTGHPVGIPAGTYLVSSAITLSAPSANLYIFGAGAFATTIQTTSPTSDILDVSVFDFQIEDVSFNTSTTRTAGSYINVTSSNSGSFIEHCIFTGYFIGITAAGNNGVYRDCGFAAPATSAIGIVVSGQGTGLLIDGCTWYGPNVNVPYAGIKVLNAGALTISNCNIISQNIGLSIETISGAFATVVLSIATYYDHCASYGVQIIGPGNTERCRFVNSWFCDSDYGVAINPGAGGSASAISFTDCHFHQNSNDGLAIGMGSSAGNIGDIAVNGGTFGGNGNGVFVQAGASDFSIVNAAFGPFGGSGINATGIDIAVGASNRYIIAQNRFRSNTINISDGGTGTKFVGNNILA